MSHKILQNSSFHRFLKTIDYELSEEERVKSCAHCGGRLHRADYPPSPLEVPAEHREFYEERYSHCCAQCLKGRCSVYNKQVSSIPPLTPLAPIHNSGKGEAGKKPVVRKLTPEDIRERQQQRNQPASSRPNKILHFNKK